jgi:hypothetical protein
MATNHPNPRKLRWERLRSLVIAAASAAISFYGLVFRLASSLLEPAPRPGIHQERA